MAFTLAAIVGSTTVTLTNGSPYKLLSARGMGGAPIRRLTAQGPAQDGDTDLGYRLSPREIELSIGFSATTDAILDGYRDTLMGIFKPLSATPIKLRATRDDGEIRQIDCNVVGKVDIKLSKEHRPGHYHVATVRLRAPDPAYYELAPGTATVTGTAGLAANWWLAGGAISSGYVLMTGGTPAQGSVWSYAGTIQGTAGWTLALRSAFEASGAADKYAFYVDNTGGSVDATIGVSQFGPYIAAGNNAITGADTFMAAGTNNYFMVHDPDGIVNGIPTSYRDFYYRGTNAFVTTASTAQLTGIIGTARRWRSDATNTAASRWSGAIPLYALYSTDLSLSQIAALDTYMSGAVGGTVSQALAVPYEGDLPEYPSISIRGPITGPTITNTVTGDSLSFGTITIGAGTTYVINTNPLYRTVLQGTVNKREELSDDSDLGDWSLQPSPIATGGTNTIQVTGTGTGTATQVSIVYYNRFASF